MFLQKTSSTHDQLAHISVYVLVPRSSRQCIHVFKTLRENSMTYFFPIPIWGLALICRQYLLLSSLLPPLASHLLTYPEIYTFASTVMQNKTKKNYIGLINSVPSELNLDYCSSREQSYSRLFSQNGWIKVQPSGEGEREWSRNNFRAYKIPMVGECMWRKAEVVHDIVGEVRWSHTMQNLHGER